MMCLLHGEHSSTSQPSLIVPKDHIHHEACSGSLQASDDALRSAAATT